MAVRQLGRSWVQQHFVSGTKKCKLKLLFETSSMQMQEIIKFKYRNPIIMNIQDLPEEILLSLIEYLHIKELIDVELVSRFF